MLKVILAILVLFLISLMNANTYTVNLNGTAQYISIQSAIIASSNSDTVLVYPGTYFENVDFIGKQITVESLEATTNDTTYIHSTIIDGNNTGSCVRFHNAEQNATLRGFTLTHGIGYPIFADNQRRGGGIHIYVGCNVTIINCDIKNNISAIGAGIFLYDGSLNLKGLNIHHNLAMAQTAGICIEGSNNFFPSITFDPVNRCSIYDNISPNPCDILVVDVMQNIDMYLDMVTVPNPDNFYISRIRNFAQTTPFTDHIYYNRVYRAEIDHDLYVSPEGNDDNSGLNANEALKTITVAMNRIAADSLSRNTVHVLPGTYRDSDGQIFPIPLKSNVNIIGAGTNEVTLYSGETIPDIIPRFFGSSEQKNMIISGFKLTTFNNSYWLPFSFLGITNCKIHDIIMDGINIHKEGVFRFLKASNIELSKIVLRNITTQELLINFIGYWYSGTIKNCIFENIHSIWDVANEDARTMCNFWVTDSLTVENCIFRNFSVSNNQGTFNVSNNYCDNNHAPVYISIKNCLFDNIRTGVDCPISFNNIMVNDYQVTNCTFINNIGDQAAVGVSGKILMVNNIFYDPHRMVEVWLYPTAQYGYHSEISFDYNNLRNGLVGTCNPYTGNFLFYGDHNNSDDPLFAGIDSTAFNYLYLSENSPCIDAGTPDTTSLFIPIADLAGNYRIWNNRIDIGCYEYGSEPVGNNDDVQESEVSTMLTNYPNPFNPQTTIKYISKQASNVKMEIFNIRGQLVRVLVDERVLSGAHSIIWDGRDRNNQNCASGVYFCRLELDGKTMTRKIVMIK